MKENSSTVFESVTIEIWKNDTIAQFIDHQLRW